MEKVKTKRVMVGVTLSPEEQAILEDLAAHSPFLSRHRRMLAALRLGLQIAKDNPDALVPHLENRLEVA